MFYTYDQNNSGGGFVTNPAKGISHFVIVEADSADDANEKAEALGLYFDGVEDGYDCECCGDRWHRCGHHASTESPEIFGKHPSKHVEEFIKGGPHTFVHYLDGRIESFGNPQS